MLLLVMPKPSTPGGGCPKGQARQVIVDKVTSPGEAGTPVAPAASCSFASSSKIVSGHLFQHTYLLHCTPNSEPDTQHLGRFSHIPGPEPRNLPPPLQHIHSGASSIISVRYLVEILVWGIYAPSVGGSWLPAVKAVMRRDARSLSLSPSKDLARLRDNDMQTIGLAEHSMQLDARVLVWAVLGRLATSHPLCFPKTSVSRSPRLTMPLVDSLIYDSDPVRGLDCCCLRSSSGGHRFTLRGRDASFGFLVTTPTLFEEYQNDHQHVWFDCSILWWS
ncbi:hypothetical protein B0T16DRAFT_75418 [Cercophora newfieldiana]|uniref:Uncharacterized protein n=1 Tax=Cercophora newfieldiana TaxID=92897 RepID=A0AA39YGW1_9PEZI|nr:hypothetical protein B0T16DRAFT_75418 [Cercophora newfieldiana]